ncbi:MAG: ABC transporter substrate-binding protein [Candidatus Thorarchaeota archaeon]|nr:ABC transporter substrate-binding protein [Candidatus Thorarchaeota archaeon]
MLPTPLTAEDAAFTLNYYRAAVGNLYAEDLAEMTAAYAPEPYTLVVEFSEESYWYLHNIGYKEILPKHVFEEIGLDGWNTWNPMPPSDKMVTSGPFQVSQYIAGEYVELTQNPNYFGSAYNDPKIIPADDIMYRLGTTGHTLAWFAYSETPDSYWIYRDDVLIQNGDWSGGSIEISVDDLPIGLYTYNLVVSNEAGDMDSDVVFVAVSAALTGNIVFDYSHGQYSQNVKQIDDWLFSNLTALGFNCIPATGGINNSVLYNAKGFVAGSIYGTENGYSAAELAAIGDWFNSGHKFMWIGYDSDYGGQQYINDNMTAILEAVESHVYGEPLSIEDPDSNAGAGYRPIANVTGTDPTVLPMVVGVEKVLLHGPTCLYGSFIGAEGQGSVALETQSVTDVYPILRYGASATIVNSDLLNGYAHDEGDEGSFVAAALELNAGENETGVIVTSGASPYGDYRPMCADEYYGIELSGMDFVVQTIFYGIILTEVQDLVSPILNSPEDITFAFGETGYFINWEGESANPDYYSIYLNGSLYDSGTWNSSTESFNVDLDGLPVGGYNFTIVVNTTLSLEASDTVLVRVVEQSGLVDILLLNLNLIVTIGSISVIIVIVVLIFRTRSAAPPSFDFSYG